VEVAKPVTGKVISADDGLPIQGVSVKIKGTNTGTVTDTKGIYTISANVGQTLVFTYIGMLPMERLVGASNTIDVELKVDTRSLNEVVVTALGQQVKKRLTRYIATKC